MTLHYSPESQCSERPRASAFPSFLILASLFLVVALRPSIVHAADGPATPPSVSKLDPSIHCDPINWPDDLSGPDDFNAMERQPGDLSATFPSINLPRSEAGVFNETEFLPLSGTVSAANAPPAIFKSERWRTNKAVIAASVFEAAWLTADGITTAGMSRGASEGGSTWAYGRHPTPGRTAAMMAAEFAGVELSSYVLHKMKVPKWVYIAPMIVSGSLHASGAIPNWKIGQ